MGEEMIEFFLNQEPAGSPNGSMVDFESLLNELETTHAHAEDRIRLLESVNSRAMHRQRCLEGGSAFESRNTLIQSTSENTGVVGVPDWERTVVNGRNRKRDATHLIAKALAMDPPNKKVRRKGMFYDCNLCFDMARDPILTCCGHLFCWPCFYQLPYFHSNAKECPECEGVVVDTAIIPIYGNGNCNDTHKLDACRQMVPPRPKAQRIESARQQFVNQRSSSLFRARPRREQTQPRDINRALNMSERTNLVDQLLASLPLPGGETEGNRPSHALPFSGLLLQLASRHMSGNNQHPPHDDDTDSFPSIPAVRQPESQTSDIAADITTPLTFPSLSE